MTIDWKKRAKEKLLANFFLDTLNRTYEILESTKELYYSTIPLFLLTTSRRYDVFTQSGVKDSHRSIRTIY